MKINGNVLHRATPSAEVPVEELNDIGVNSHFYSNLILNENLSFKSCNQRKFLLSKIELCYSFEEQIQLSKLENDIIDFSSKYDFFNDYKNFSKEVISILRQEKYKSIINMMNFNSPLNWLRLQSFVTGVIHNSDKNKMFLKCAFSLFFKINQNLIEAWCYNLKVFIFWDLA